MRIDFSFDDFLGKVKKDERFSFSRWGDGEFNAIFMKTGENCDKHQYFNDMCEELSEIVCSSPEYIMGIQGLATRVKGTQIDSYLKLNDVNIEWSNSDILHHASIKGRIQELFVELAKKRTLVVGPEYLRGVSKLFTYHGFIEVPLIDCYLYIEPVMERIRNFLMESKKPVFVSISASMPANIMVDRLYNEFGNKHWFIDMGSIFEPYLGVKIRTYHQKIIDRLN